MTIHTGFNDAWETPGWTAQNMAYADTPAGPVTPLPMVRVHGSFIDSDDHTLEVQVRAIPSERVTTHEGSTVLIDPKAVSSQRGIVDFKIPVGDWQWTFRIRVGPDTFEKTFTPTADVDLSSIRDSGTP